MRTTKKLKTFLKSFEVQTHIVQVTLEDGATDYTEIDVARNGEEVKYLGKIPRPVMVGQGPMGIPIIAIDQVRVNIEGATDLESATRLYYEIVAKMSEEAEQEAEAAKKQAAQPKLVVPGTANNSPLKLVTP